ncbi:MAG: N-acetyltransferase family protein [Negativicoccus massiliensis]|uniref:GNAT family N-acetyltransferase n=1 Tax=Negativicoccus succinicivorans TaxID=620903 RepID=UPI0026EE340B|nr:GNAT family N-acetyltransferase [Negativicoccus succinicivorans]MBS5887384.1 N-acetyltransferase [Negativicoccus succinicivorans]MDU4641556.1 N-acetyltransferase family protein [Negativicoccus massiliensis]MDU5027348.1 N-acetyltransferase family protein [Negativicoccus succinicivorans]
MATLALRPVDEKDTSALRAIYAPYIATPITFEIKLPSEAAYAERIEEIAAMYPYIVAEYGGEIVGYAYAHRHMDRAAYDWNAEVSIYLARNVTHRGIGTKLMGALLEILARQGIRNAYSLITLPNPASIRLHTACGFRQYGIMHQTGFKAGIWYDVGCYEKTLAAHEENPGAPVSWRAISDAAVRTVLARWGTLG